MVFYFEKGEIGASIDIRKVSLFGFFSKCLVQLCLVPVWQIHPSDKLSSESQRYLDGLNLISNVATVDGNQ